MADIQCFGVDAGYGWLKLVGEDGKIKIPSIIGSAREPEAPTRCEMSGGIQVG